MTKAYFFLLSILYCTSSFSQKTTVVEYANYNDVDIPNIIKATLYVSGKTSVYRERISNIEHWEDKENLHPNAKFSKYDSIYDTYVKTDQEKKEVLFYDDVMKYTFLISDQFTLKWTISDSVKQVLGYKCYLAKTNFRGRQWEAWFTPEIAAPFGPWKLHGLPGLILEAQDTTKKFTIVATAIHYRSSDIITKDFSTLRETQNKLPITMQDFINKSDEIMDNSFKRQVLEYPDATIMREPVPRGGKELKYEWEE